VGKPEEKTRVEDTVFCDPAKLPVQVPRCEVKEGEDPYEIHELDVFQKRVEQEVIRWREIKVKRRGGDKKKTAKVSNLVQLDLKPILKPLVAELYAQYGVEMVDRAVILAEIAENLDGIKDLALAANPEPLEKFLDELASQETYKTF